MHRPVGLALLHKPTAAEAPHGFIHLQRRYKHPARRKRPKRWEPPRTKPLDIERKIKNPILHDQRMGSVETLMEGELFTPESCKARKLAMLFNRLHYFGYANKMPELVHRYADRAVLLAPGMMPRQFALVLNSLARADQRHDGLLETFARHIPPHLPDFVPQDLSLTCNAYGKLLLLPASSDEAPTGRQGGMQHQKGKGDDDLSPLVAEESSGVYLGQGPPPRPSTSPLVKRLFRRMAEEIPHKLPYFEPRHVSSVANGYAKLNFRDQVLFDDIADEALSRLEEFGAWPLSNLMHAFARVGYGKQRFWVAAMERAQESLTMQGAAGGYGDTEASDHPLAYVMVTYAVGKAGIRQEAFLDWMAERLLERLPELPPETLGVIVNAYARLDRFHSALFKAISERVVAGDVEELNPVSVTQLVNGYARVECFDAALFKALARRIHALLDHFSAQSLSNIVHGYARLKIQDVKLFVAVARVIPKRLGEFEPQAMAITAHAYAKLMIRSEILFHLLANEILNKLPLFTGQGLGLVLYSYARLHIANAKLISASLRFLKHQIDELSRLEILTIRHALRNLGVLDEALQSALEKRLAEMTPFQPFEALNEDLLQSLANRSEEEEDTLVRMEEGEGEADGWVERQPPLRQRKYAAAAAAGGGGGVGGEDASGEIPVVVSRSGGRKSSRRAAVEMPDPAEDDPSHTPSIVDMWRLGDSEFSRALDRPTPPSAIRTWAQQQQQQQGAAAQTTGDTDTPHPGPQPTQGSIMMDGMAGRKHRKRPQRLFGPADVKVHDSVGVGVGVGAKGLEEHPPPRVGPIGQEEEGYDDTTWEGGYEDVVGADMGVGGARGGVGGTDRGRGRKSARGRKVDGM